MSWIRAITRPFRAMRAAAAGRKEARALLVEAEQITRDAYRIGVTEARRNHPSNQRRTEHPENRG